MSFKEAEPPDRPSGRQPQACPLSETPALEDSQGPLMRRLVAAATVATALGVTACSGSAEPTAAHSTPTPTANAVAQFAASLTADVTVVDKAMNSLRGLLA